MATTTQVSLSEYLHTVYEPDAEYVDGEIEERAVGKFIHARWQSAIQRWFLLQADEWNVWVLPELRVQVGPTRVRIPDVALTDRALPEEEVITYPPIAVFEVLSPDDRVPRTVLKLQDYERMGVRNIFLIDPQDRSAWQFVHGELKPAVSGPLDGTVCIVDWEQIRKYVG